MFDGRGAEYLARVTRRERNRAELQVLQRHDVERELPFPLHVAVALPKGDRQKWLVEKSVELGVTSITPLLTERGVAVPGSGGLERLRRTVVESSKQCGRNRLMEILAAKDWSAFCHETPATTRRLIAHPAQPGLPTLDPRELALGAGDPVTVVVGPEGGFTANELDVARKANWEFVSLGPRILRVETACLALAALIALRTTSGEEER